MNLRSLIENNKFKIKKLQGRVDEIEKLSDAFANMSDEELQAETPKLRKLYQEGKSLDSLLVEAFAAIREADRRVLGLYPYPVQLMGGIVLHEGNLAEMKTGEGKTLTETMPVYLNALAGKGVHVITVNEYLSERDSQEMGQVFRWMGLTVGFNNSKMSSYQKREAYACDVTYTTNDELAFDYLRDNMAFFKDDECQRGLNYAIVDEVDSILIDEARTPLIISGKEESYKTLYTDADKFAKYLNKEDYYVDKETKSVSLEPSGVDKANQFFGINNLFDADAFVYAHYVDEALKANYTMEKDKDYIVKDNAVLIVDSFTGRVQPDRRFSDGLHQALEAKEKVPIKDASKTDADITYQNFFRMYNKLSGMSGTASTESKEFYQTYHMDVVTIPTNRPIQRKDLPDVIYPTLRAKFKAVVNEISRVHATGQPILVGTASVEHSELISNLLDKTGIEHSVLNAKDNKKEAQIISQAGQMGAVTIATNMAGRGTDIKLGLGVKELGGLFVLGTEKHESRRIDNQLRGRSGRQGDPGTTIFFTSLEDDLIVRFGGEKVQKVKRSLISQGHEYKPIQSKIINKAVESAQKRVEGNNYDDRKNTLKYDDVMRDERNRMYAERKQVMDFEGDFNPYLLGMFGRTINRYVDIYSSGKGKRDIDGLFKFAKSVLGIRDEYDEELEDIITHKNNQEIKEYLQERVEEELQHKTEELVHPEQLRQFTRLVILRVVNTDWKQHIDNMEQLRMSITLRGYGQYNPLVEYQNTAFYMYKRLIEDIEHDVTRTFLRAEIKQGGVQ